MTPRRTTGIALAFATATISGSAVYVNGFAVKHFDDATVYTTAKNGVAAILLAGLLAVSPAARVRATRRPSRRQRMGIAAVGIIGGGVPFVLFFEGLARAPSVQAAFIHKTLVIWVALLAVPLLRERLTAVHLGAIGALVAGQAALTGDLTRLRSSSGELMILAATLLWAAETVLAKRLLGSIRPLTLGVARMGIGLAALLVFLGFTGRAGVLASFSAQQWWWVILTGTILTGYVATWYAALQRAPAVDVTAVLVFGAVVTAMLASGFTAAPLAPKGLGLGLITAGAAAIAVRTFRRARTRTVPT